MMLRLGSSSLELQGEAIRTMAVFQGKRPTTRSAEVYRTTTDPKIKKSIISAMFITRDAPHMVEMARNEKDLELKRANRFTAGLDERQSGNRLHDGVAQVS